MHDEYQVISNEAISDANLKTDRPPHLHVVGPRMLDWLILWDEGASRRWLNLDLIHNKTTVAVSSCKFDKRQRMCDPAGDDGDATSVARD